MACCAHCFNQALTINFAVYVWLSFCPCIFQTPSHMLKIDYIFCINIRVYNTKNGWSSCYFICFVKPVSLCWCWLQSKEKRYTGDLNGTVWEMIQCGLITFRGLEIQSKGIDQLPVHLVFISTNAHRKRNVIYYQVNQHEVLYCNISNNIIFLKFVL